MRHDLPDLGVGTYTEVFKGCILGTFHEGSFDVPRSSPILMEGYFAPIAVLYLRGLLEMSFHVKELRLGVSCFVQDL